MSKLFDALTEASKNKQDESTRFDSTKAKKPIGEGPIRHMADSDIAEYKLLRQRISKLTPHLHQRALLFIGLSPGSLNVAADFCFTVSGAGEKVLFVGVNTDQHYARQLFGISQSPGVAELFCSDCVVQELIYRTVYPNLFFLPAAIPRVNFISSDEEDVIRRAIAEMKALSRWTILHCPPPSLFCNAPVIASAVDGVILVIQAGKTERKTAQQTRKKLSESGAHLLGTVLTNQRNYIPSWILSKL